MWLGREGGGAGEPQRTTQGTARPRGWRGLLSSFSWLHAPGMGAHGGSTIWIWRFKREMAKPVFPVSAFPSAWEPRAPCTCHFAGLCQQGPGQTRPPCRARGICVTEVTRPVGSVEARAGATTHGTHVRVCALACTHPSRALVPVCRGLPGRHVVDVQRTRPASAGWQRGAQARGGSRSHSCVVTWWVGHRSATGEKVAKLSCHRHRLSVAPRP